MLNSIKRLGDASEDDLLSAVYDDVPAALHGVAGRSLLAHLIKLHGDGVLCHSASGWRLTE